MAGLVEGSRALQSLRSKFPSSPSSTSSANPARLHLGENAAPTDTELLDGAIDLVMRCLEIEPTNRPTADLVCDHQFVLGEGGWKGFRGWQSDGCDSSSDGD